MFKINTTQHWQVNNLKKWLNLLLHCKLHTYRAYLLLKKWRSQPYQFQIYDSKNSSIVYSHSKYFGIECWCINRLGFTFTFNTPITRNAIEYTDQYATSVVDWKPFAIGRTFRNDLFRMALRYNWTILGFMANGFTTNCEWIEQIKFISWLIFYIFQISWLCIIAASSVGYIYVGRFAAGICTGGIFTLIPLYVSEISNASLRGILGSFFLLTVNLGTLLMFIIGSYLSYSIVSSLMLSFPLIFMLLFLFFPETPYYLLKCSKTKKAENSLKFLHGCRKAEETPDILKVELLLIAKKVEHDASIHEMVSIAKEFSE